MRKALIVFTLVIALLFVVSTTAAQPSHQCGLLPDFTVVYPYDKSGYAVRPAPGSEAIVNCIAARDPNFSTMRFRTPIQALNYWMTLYGQELGVQVLLLPDGSG